MHTLIRIFKYILPFKVYLLISLLCMLIHSAATVAMPWMMRLLIDTIPSGDVGRINLVLTASLAIAFLLGISRYGQAISLNFVGQKAVFNMRNEMFSHLMKLSVRFYSEKRRGELISRMTNDLLILQNFLSEEILGLVKKPIVIVGSICVLFYIHAKLTLLTLILAPIIAKVIVNFGERMRRITLSTQRRMADLVSVTTEVLHNIKTVKIFTKEDYEKRRFCGKNEGYFRMAFSGIKLLTLSVPLVEFLGTAGIIAICGYGAYEVTADRLTIGKLVAFLFYIGTISSPIKSLTKANLLIQQAISAGDHIFEILDRKAEIVDLSSATPIVIKGGEIVFRGVSFSYLKEPVLSNIDLKIEAGEVLAIVGPTGSGKSTIVNLILRLYEPDLGEILIDGQNIKMHTVKSIRERIGVVPQDVSLFSGSIAENIAYGNPSISMREIEDAAKASGCDEFVSKLSDGYLTQIGEYGVRLSGGQRQRIAIARALITKPAILILDEATSNIDQESERLIRSAISKIMRRQTTIIISHRLSGVVDVDRICVLDRGKIVECGKHSELMERGGLYKRLYEAG